MQIRRIWLGLVLAGGMVGQLGQAHSPAGTVSPAHGVIGTCGSAGGTTYPGMLAVGWITASPTFGGATFFSYSMLNGVVGAGVVVGNMGCTAASCRGVGAQGSANPGTKTAYGHWGAPAMTPVPTCHWELTNADGLPVELLEFTVDE